MSDSRAHVGARRERWSRGRRAQVLAEYRARRLAGHTAISSLRSAREVQRRREDVTVLAWLLATYGADARGFRECSAEHDRRAAHLLLGELPGADLVEVVWDWRAERGIPVIGQVLGPRCWEEGCMRPRRFMQPPARSAWCQEHSQADLENPFGGRASDTAPVVTVVVPDRGQSADAVMDEAIAIATGDRPPTYGYRLIGAARAPDEPISVWGEELIPRRQADSWNVSVADLPDHVNVIDIDENASRVLYEYLPFGLPRERLRAVSSTPVVRVVVLDHGQSADEVYDTAIAIATRDRPPTHGYRILGAARPPSTPFDVRVGEEQRSWRQADSWIVNVADLPGHVSVTGVDENASLIRYVDLPFELASQRELDDLARGYGLFRDPGETDDDLARGYGLLLAPPGSRPGLRGLVRDTVVRDEVDPRGSR